MQNEHEFVRANHRASTKTCIDCARLWKEYFEVDKRFRQAASGWLSHVSQHNLIQVCRESFNVRSEVEYQKQGELRREARKAITDHWVLLHPLTARIGLGAKRHVTAKEAPL